MYVIECAHTKCAHTIRLDVEKKEETLANCKSLKQYVIDCERAEHEQSIEPFELPIFQLPLPKNTILVSFNELLHIFAIDHRPLFSLFLQVSVFCR